jgi:hypothetical protein
MVRRILDLFRGGPKARRSLEITVQDQWVLKVLLRGDRWVAEEAIIEEATMERPTLIPHELVASILKLQLVGYIEADGRGQHRITKRGKKLKGIIPERPGVNIEYYG